MVTELVAGPGGSIVAHPVNARPNGKMIRKRRRMAVRSCLALMVQGSYRMVRTPSGKAWLHVETGPRFTDLA